MASGREKATGTQQRLLEAACVQFAEKGFHEATIAEICEQAGANIAAVNYHFGDKATLYTEAWKLTFQRSIAAHPPDGGVPPEAPADQRLRGKIQAIMERICDPNCHEFEIVHKEMANPTGLLTEAMLECIEPIRQCFIDLVRELLGVGASDQQILLCQMSIKAQCFDLLMHRRHGPHGKTPFPPGPWSPDLAIPALAAHVTRFSLAGIREIKRQIAESESTHE